MLTSTVALNLRRCCLQLAGLSADDMIAVNNMRCLCGPDTKKSSVGGFTLKFDVHKVKILGYFPACIYICNLDLKTYFFFSC